MLVNANALRIPLKDKSVQMCVTSPPYWGLRDYGIDNQLGLEQTPEEYVENMVAVFREVWRVLRDDGTLWLNLGDSYNGSGGAGGDYNKGGLKEGQPKYGRKFTDNLKPKDLVGIPWRVAFALQADGWYLRNDIIWHKPNPMPESVKDRCTKSHEYIFLLTKNARYYYDNKAVKEGFSEKEAGWIKSGAGITTFGLSGQAIPGDNNQPSSTLGGRPNPSGRNKRTVWTMTTKPYKGAHYATFPPELPEVCIKAGTSEKGKCSDCGSPWERIIEKGDASHLSETESTYEKDSNAGRIALLRQAARADGNEYSQSTKTLYWEPSCECGKEPVPCIVLDPFIGSGTTCMVARDLGRNSVGLDLSLEYLIDNAKKRLELDKLEYWKEGGKEVEGNYQGLPMFSDEQAVKDHKNMHRENPHSFHKERIE